jgi:hypothetical protein
MHPIPAYFNAARRIPAVQDDGLWSGGNSLRYQAAGYMDPSRFKPRPLLNKKIMQTVRHLANPKLFEQA